MEETTQKSSEVIEAFICLLEEAPKKFNAAYELVGAEDRKSGDILHFLELEEVDEDKYGEILIQLQTVRKDRRYYKDLIELYDPIKKYIEENKKAVEQLKQMLGKVRKAEAYHEERSYIPRELPEIFNEEQGENECIADM